MSTELAVIVTTHNRADLVDEALSSLAEQTWDDGTWKVVVVDNASTDSTPEVLARWAHQMPVPFEVVTANDGRGPSYARNAGVFQPPPHRRPRHAAANDRRSSSVSSIRPA